MNTAPSKRDGEEGFVLVSAIWLLLLGAAVVALIQFTVLNRAKNLAFDKEQIGQRLALETAYETAVADLLFNGPRSEFSKLPATANYTLNGKSMTIHVSSESGKLDINDADLALIDRALMGLGVDATKRSALQGLLLNKRSSTSARLASSEIEQLLQEVGLGPNSGQCIDRFFTAHSGLERPTKGQMPPELSQAIGEPNTPTQAGIQPGQALEIVIRAQSFQPLKAVVRISGRLDHPVELLDWKLSEECAN